MYNGSIPLAVPNQKPTTMTEHFFINGYWKDDKTEFENYIVRSTDDTGYNYGMVDDDIFFYGLSENEIKDILGNENTGLDFVITSYEKLQDQDLKKQEIVFTHNENDYVIEFDVEDQDFWVTIDGWDIHYCEDYNEICVYEYGNYRKSVYSRKIKD